MSRLQLVVAVCFAAAAGCQRTAPPQWDTLNPFGATRVPPPATGGYGQPNNYYQGPTVPPGVPSFEVGKQPKSGSLGATQGWSSTASVADASTAELAESPQIGSGANVRTASANLASVSPFRIDERRTETSPTSQPTARAQRGGMMVTDLTRTAEPNVFQAPANAVDIRQADARDSRIASASFSDSSGSQSAGISPSVASPAAAGVRQLGGAAPTATTDRENLQWRSP